MKKTLELKGFKIVLETDKKATSNYNLFASVYRGDEKTPLCGQSFKDATEATDWAKEQIIDRMPEDTCLFENYQLLPTRIEAILTKYADADEDYETCRKMLKDMEAQGYTFEYYLDAQPYDLKKIKK